MTVESLEIFGQSRSIFAQSADGNIDRSAVLAKAQARNVSIPALIKSDRVLQERRASRTGLIRVLGRVWYVRSGSTLEGQANLEEAMELAENGTPTVSETPHFSDSDHALKRIVFGRNGYGRFADNTDYLAGLKMLERADIRQFASSENMLLTPTPFDIEEVEAALKLPRLTPDEIYVLQRLRRNYVNLATKALRIASESMDSRKGRMIGSYPESTRSRTGFVGRARPETNAWYRLKEGTYIIPVAVEGGQYMHPPGKFPFRRVNAKVIVGKPFPYEEVVKKAQEVPETDRQQFIADYAFSKVVSLLDPHLINPTQRQYYKLLATI